MGIAFGTSVSKLDFYKVVKFEPIQAESGQNLETREVVLKLTLPTPQLIELLHSSISGILTNREQFVAGSEQQLQAIKSYLDRMSVNES